MRIITIGPLPPEWGGPRPGGVATAHRVLIEELSRDHDVSVVNWTQSEQVQILRPDKTDPEMWYADQASRADVVIMFHVSTPWAVYHSRSRPAPAVGSVQSWTPVLRDRSKGEQTNVGMSGMDVLVFPSDHCRQQGLELGFHYPVPTMVVHHALSEEFRRVHDLNGRRNGVVFVGSDNPVKRLSLAREACRSLGLPLTVITGRPRSEVREACLKAEIMCVPSSSESFGIAYIEGAACGIPSVGYAPAVDEISATLGVRMGIGVRTSVQDALKDALGISWNRQELSRRTTETFSPEKHAAEYWHAIETAIDRFGVA